MATDATDFGVATRENEQAEGTRQEAEKLIAQIKQLFPEVERVVAGSDFGKEAIEKARNVVQKASSLIEKGDMENLSVEIDALARTQRMFKGVVGRIE